MIEICLKSFVQSHGEFSLSLNTEPQGKVEKKWMSRNSKFYLKWSRLTRLCLLKLEYMESLACSLAFQIGAAPWSMSNDEGYKESCPCPTPFIHLLTLCFLLIFSLLMDQERKDLLSGFLRKKDLHIGKSFPDLLHRLF